MLGPGNFQRLTGKNRLCMSNEMKECLFFSLMLPNHSITFCVFLHWFTFKINRRCVFSLSKIDLLILPESLLAGLMSRHFGLFSKFSL